MRHSGEAVIGQICNSILILVAFNLVDQPQHRLRWRFHSQLQLVDHLQQLKVAMRRRIGAFLQGHLPQTADQRVQGRDDGHGGGSDGDKDTESMREHEVMPVVQTGMAKQAG